MFGQIKENILHDIESVKNDNKEFKTKFSNFYLTLKESVALKTFYDIYDQVNTVKFKNKSVAKDFLDECLNALSYLDKNEISKLKSLTESKDVRISSKIANLDKIVFNENLSLKEKHKCKDDLINSLYESDDIKKPDTQPLDILKNIDKKVTENINKLNKEQLEVVELFMEGDKDKINSFYTNLIENTMNVLDNKVLESSSVDDSIKMIQVKRELLRLKSLTPEINVIDNVLDLKNSINIG